MNIKIMTMLAACMCACVAFSEMPRSEWIGKVGDCVQDSSQIAGIMKQLTPADQCQFLGELNTAISKMAGSQESKEAMFLKANKAALVAATASNRADMLAEVFATVPPEFLTIINENFAETLFSRKGDTARTYTDGEYLALCNNALSKVYARTASVENSAVRNTFAILMFVNASGGTPVDLAEKLADTLPSGKDIAKNEWLPQALGKNQAKSYDAMLGAAQADEEANHEVTVQIAGPQMRQALLGDLQSLDSSRVGMGKHGTPFSDAMGSGQGHLSDLGMLRIPRAELLANPRGRYYGPTRDGNGARKRGDYDVPVKPQEPEPYVHQGVGVN